MSDLENILEFHMLVAGLPEPVREYRFHKPRRWRFDFAFPEQMVAIECEGGIHSGGRHVRGSGFEKDCEKYNQAALDGWTLLRYTSSMIKSGIALQQIEEALK